MRSVIPSDIISIWIWQSGYVKNAIVGLLFEGALGALLMVCSSYFCRYIAGIHCYCYHTFIYIICTLRLFITGQRSISWRLVGLPYLWEYLWTNHHYHREYSQPNSKRKISRYSNYRFSRRNLRAYSLLSSPVFGRIVPVSLWLESRGGFIYTSCPGGWISMIASYFISQTLVPILQFGCYRPRSNTMNPFINFQHLMNSKKNIKIFLKNYLNIERVYYRYML